jgi:glycosyltransferase involved in cell wall biosynthesis
MRILVISTFDIGGGAEKIAFDLSRSYLERGHDVRLMVRFKRTSYDWVVEFNPYESLKRGGSVPQRLETWIRSLPQFRGQYRLVDWIRRSAYPMRWVHKLRGIEDFNYASPKLLLSNSLWKPEVIHAHNLHGDYFDLRSLRELSREMPIVWTLHDAWILSGHCAYFIDCMKWTTGCGHCPDLDRAPKVFGDQTERNLKRKLDIYRSSTLNLATPSKWLMNCVVNAGINAASNRVIEYGVDTRIFRPADRSEARKSVGIPADAFVCLFVAFGGKSNNPYKDYVTVEKAIEEVTGMIGPTKIVFICIGGEPESPRGAGYHYIPFIKDPSTLAKYYQAANVLLHAANADNFPCVIIEALACGTPVIATDVGGISEQIDHDGTGFLVPRHDSHAMACHITEMVFHPELSQAIGAKASAIARTRFDLERQANDYLMWFNELLTKR